MHIDKPAIKNQFLKCRILKCILGCFIGCTLFSCGKAVQEDNSDDVNRNPALSTTSEYIYSEAGRDTYDFGEMAEVYIPSRLNYESGETAEIAKLFFSKGFDEEEAFHCEYKYTLGATYYSFDGCPGSEKTEGEKVIQSPGHSVSIEATNAVEVELEIDWFQ